MLLILHIVVADHTGHAVPPVGVPAMALDGARILRDVRLACQRATGGSQEVSADIPNHGLALIPSLRNTPAILAHRGGGRRHEVRASRNEG